MGFNLLFYRSLTQINEKTFVGQMGLPNRSVMILC
jgi:hypothetical protein